MRLTTLPLPRCRKETDLGRVCLTIDSKLDELFIISVLIRGICDHLHTNATQKYSLELCAVEAVTNVIKHAYRGIAGHQVSLDISYSPDRIDLQVCDEGLSMPQDQIDRLANGSPVFDFDPQCLLAIPEGGMGLALMRHEMDEISYSAQNGGNRLRLTKFIHPGTAASRI